MKILMILVLLCGFLFAEKQHWTEKEIMEVEACMNAFIPKITQDIAYAFYTCSCLVEHGGGIEGLSSMPKKERIKIVRKCANYAAGKINEVPIQKIDMSTTRP